MARRGIRRRICGSDKQFKSWVMGLLTKYVKCLYTLSICNVTVTLNCMYRTLRKRLPVFTLVMLRHSSLRGTFGAPLGQLMASKRLFEETTDDEK
jgi:hypothetical protein